MVYSFNTITMKIQVLFKRCRQAYTTIYMESIGPRTAKIVLKGKNKFGKLPNVKPFHVAIVIKTM